MGLLGILATVALLVGGVGSTMVLTSGEGHAAADSRTPVVEVQEIRTDAGYFETADR